MTQQTMLMCSSVTYDTETCQMKAHASIVRKDAWTKEEADLLRNCIERLGEGEWSKVPQRAGPNRCRKGCRLRWLNYLKPNIKRGVFQEDEVDMIIRLHKLLGNRWSLIAGRLPGRTANHVKNYCQNKLLVKKPRQRPLKEEEENGQGHWDVNRVKAIKPRPHNISQKLGHFGTSRSPTDDQGTQVEVGYASAFITTSEMGSQRQRDGIGLELYETDADPLGDIWMAEGFELDSPFFNSKFTLNIIPNIYSRVQLDFTRSSGS